MDAEVQTLHSRLTEEKSVVGGREDARLAMREAWRETSLFCEAQEIFATISELSGFTKNSTHIDCMQAVSIDLRLDELVCDGDGRVRRDAFLAHLRGRHVSLEEGMGEGCGDKWLRSTLGQLKLSLAAETNRERVMLIGRKKMRMASLVDAAETRRRAKEMQQRLTALLSEASDTYALIQALDGTDALSMSKRGLLRAINIGNAQGEANNAVVAEQHRLSELPAMVSPQVWKAFLKRQVDAMGSTSGVEYLHDLLDALWAGALPLWEATAPERDAPATEPGMPAGYRDIVQRARAHRELGGGGGGGGKEEEARRIGSRKAGVLQGIKWRLHQHPLQSTTEVRRGPSDATSLMTP